MKGSEEILTELAFWQNAKRIYSTGKHFAKNPKDVAPAVRISRSKNKLKHLIKNPKDVPAVIRYGKNMAKDKTAAQIKKWKK